MSRTIQSGISLFALLALTGAAFAQAPVLKDDFEEKCEGWLAFGPHAKVAVTTEAGKAKTGRGALEFRYRIGDKSTDGKDAQDAKTTPAKSEPAFSFDALLRATPDGALAKMRSLRFSVKTDVDAPLFVSLSEKDGGRYNTIVWVSKGEWHDIAPRS